MPTSYSPNNMEKDNSFKGFIAALLFFLGLCLIIYLVLTFAVKKGDAKDTYQSSSLGENQRTYKRLSGSITPNKNTTTVSSKDVNPTTDPSENLNTTTVSRKNENTSTDPSANLNTTTVSSTNENTSTDPSANLNTTTYPSENLNTTTVSRTNENTSTDPSANLNTTTYPSENLNTTTVSSTNENTSTDPSAKLNTTTYPSENLNTTTVSSTNENTSTDPSANLNTTTVSSTNENTSTDPSANLNTTTYPSENLNTTTVSSTNENTSTDPSANLNTTTYPSENLNTTTVSSTNENTSTDPSANLNTTTDTSAILKTTTATSTDPSANLNTTTYPSENLNTTTVSRKNENTSTDPSANLNTTTVSSTNENTSTDPSANLNTTTYPSENLNTTTVSSTNENTSTDPSANLNTTTYPSENLNTTTVSSTNENTSTDPSANLNTTTDPSAILKTTTAKAVIVKPVCHSASCRKESQRISSQLATSELDDACNNFYKFACGDVVHDFNKKREINALMEEYLRDNEQPPEFIKHYKQFFSSCINYKRKEELNLNYNTRIQFIQEKINNPLGGIEDIFADAVLTQSLPFLDVNLELLSDSYQIKISRDGNGLIPTIEDWKIKDLCKKECIKSNMHRFDHFTNRLVDTKLYEEYDNCIDNCPKKGFNAFIKILNVQTPQTYNATFEAILNENLKIENYNKTSETVNVVDLDKTLGLNLNWTYLFLKLTGKNIKTVMVEDKEYFRQIFKNLDNATLGQFVVLMQYHTILKHLNNLGKDEYCLDLRKQLMPDITNYILQETFNTTIIKDSLKKVESYKSSLINVISDLNEKTTIHNIEIIPPNYDPDFEIKLKNLYSPLTDNFLENLIKLVKLRRKKLFQMAEKEFNVTDFFNNFITEKDENIRAILSQNSIVIPYQVIQRISTTPDITFLGRIVLKLAIELMKFVPPAQNTEYQNIINMTNNDEFKFLDTSMHIFQEDILLDKLNRFEEEFQNFVKAFDLVKSLRGGSKETLPPIFDIPFDNDKIFYLTSAQEFCYKNNDEIDFALNLKYGDHLPSIFVTNKIILEAQASFNCTVKSLEKETGN